MDYKSKYLKYKAKYLQLKQAGGKDRLHAYDLPGIAANAVTKLVTAPLAIAAKGTMATYNAISNLGKGDQEIAEINRIIK